MIGQTIGSYRITAKLGEGGMGEVYRATDTRLGREVAIKISKTEFSERFEREARAIAALNHPNICTLYDVGPNYLVMEYVEGTPLKGPLPVNKAVEYAGQILDALDAAHRKCITHRDLKPANILVTKAGVKLLDFGLAKQGGPVKETDSTVTQGLTGQDQIVGTLHYMSPEQLQGKDVDARSDLFSFGCVLYEMLTGRRAFEGQSAASIIAAVLEREPAPLNLGPPLERVVRTCLAKDPEQRFQTALDLKRALLWAVEPQQDGVVIQHGTSRWWIATAAALVLGAGAAWSVAHFGGRVSSDDRVLRFEIAPPEGGRFRTTGDMAVSRDGKLIAYGAVMNGKSQLWVRPLDGAARPLPGTENAQFPFFSPDDKSLGFFAAQKLWRVDLSGGAPLAICDAAETPWPYWTDDGRILFGGSSGIRQVPASGGTPSQLTTADTSLSERLHIAPQMLPGGRFVYLAVGNKPGIYEALFAEPAERVQLLNIVSTALYAPGPGGRSYLLSLRGTTLMAQEFDPAAMKLAGEPQPLTQPVGGPGIGLFAAASANGLLIYATPTARNLTWVDRAGKPLGLLADGDYFDPRISPDGRHVAANRYTDTGREVATLEVERGIASRFTTAGLPANRAQWSPNGRRIVFGSGNALSSKEASGAGNEERFNGSANRKMPSDWSKDGHFILYEEIDPETQTDLWVLPVTPEGKFVGGAKPYLREPFNQSYGRISPDSRWVAYQSDESGQYEVFLQAFPEPHGKLQISTNGGFFPSWGADGRELFYQSSDSKMMAASLKLGSDRVEASNPRVLFSLPGETSANGAMMYDAAPDGQRFLVKSFGEQSGSQPLNVIVNWPALLKKGASAQ